MASFRLKGFASPFDYTNAGLTTSTTPLLGTRQGVSQSVKPKSLTTRGRDNGALKGYLTPHEQFTCSDKELQPDGKCLVIERLTINYSRSGPQSTARRLNNQTRIRRPRPFG
jgi:hypothetical protein